MASKPLQRIWVHKFQSKVLMLVLELCKSRLCEKFPADFYFYTFETFTIRFFRVFLVDL